MKDLLPWANPVFADVHTVDVSDSSNECASDRWIFRSERRFNVRVFAYLLLSEFGGGKVIMKCVSESLLSRIFDDSRFSDILKGISERKNRYSPTPSDDSLNQQIDALLKDAFVRVDADCHEAVTLLETNTDNSWDDSAAALTGGCSVVFALILDDRLYVANCGHSVAIFGKKVGDEMTVFTLSRTVESCDCSLICNTHESTSSGTANKIEQQGNYVKSFLEFIRCRPRSCFGDYGHKPDAAAAAAILSSTMEAPPAKRWAGIADANSTAEPFILPEHIELNDSTRFLLLVSPQTAKIVQLLNSNRDVRPNAILASQLLQILEDTGYRNTFDSIRYLLNDLLSRFVVACGTNLAENPSLWPNLAMVYINLEYDPERMDMDTAANSTPASKSLRDALSDVMMADDNEMNFPLPSASGMLESQKLQLPPQIAQKAQTCSDIAEHQNGENNQTNLMVQGEAIGRRHESAPDHLANECNNDDEISMSATGAGTSGNDPAIPSVVDWSEFYTHELHDTVLAKIESLKQLYQDRRKLASLDEIGDS